jgi:adenine-specific DNA-methyltransferase
MPDRSYHCAPQNRQGELQVTSSELSTNQKPARKAPQPASRRLARAELIWEGKYDADGRRVAPLRVALPFQTVETVNESAQDRQRGFLFGPGLQEEEWRNRLIWGDKKYVLPSLLTQFAGKVNLIYIDPPFDTGQDFSFPVRVPENPDTQDDSFTFTKEPSILEHKAFRDIWGGPQTRLEAYLKWFYETVVLLHELLHENGSMFVHLDWHCGHYAKIVLDEIFSQDHFVNEIIWWYYNKFQGNVNHFASDHDVILWYRKGDKYQFAPQKEERSAPVRQIKREWDKEKGRIVNVKGSDGKMGK